MSTILIIGGTGLLGSRIAALFSEKHKVSILSRKPNHTNQHGIRHYHWHPDKNIIDAESLQADVIINLVGAGIVEKRWTDKRKKEIIESRVNPTLFLAKRLQSSGFKPSLYIGASAIGIYGNRGEEIVTESSSLGHDFLSQCCQAWESAHDQVSQCAKRSLILRLGIVLSGLGGALPQMLITKPMGFLTYFGKGEMYYSWIHIDDVVGVINQALNDTSYHGILNIVAPEAISQKSFIHEFVHHIRSPRCLLSVPLWVIKLVLGEMSAVLINSQRIKPQRLLALQYPFKYSDLPTAVVNLLQPCRA